MIIYIIFTGDRIWQAFGQIGNLCSIIPEKAKTLALTATATSEVLSTVKAKLNLVDVLDIVLPPDRGNIKYYVEPLLKLEILCQLLCEGLNQLRKKFPKTLIFCRTISECVTIYKTMRNSLGRTFTDPAGYPDYHCFQLLDMYTRAYSDEMKAKVLIKLRPFFIKLPIVWFQSVNVVIYVKVLGIV